jgi:Na+-driven multidrug efflux pump
VVPTWFSTDPQVRSLASASLLVVALQQPLAGIVFVLDGVLLGASDNRYLAGSQLAALAAFLPCALLVVHAADTSVVQLWWALTVFMVVRAAAFAWRIRGQGWLETA